MENPQKIVDILTIYNDPEIDIERELVQLSYFGHVSYFDLQFMSYKIRQFWIEEIKKYITEEKKQMTGP